LSLSSLLILNIYTNLTLLDNGYYASIFLSYLYFCMNPFIYATKFEPVNRVLLRLIPCMKSSVQPIQSVAMSTVTSTYRATYAATSRE